VPDLLLPLQHLEGKPLDRAVPLLLSYQDL
jgi:hypothetical protein